MESFLKKYFTSNEIVLLYSDMINNFNNGIILKESGRLVVFTELKGIEIIKKKIETSVNKIYNDEYTVGTAAYHLYSNQYGTPECKPHIDDYIGEVVFDYQINANINWPLRINKNDYILNNNDAVLFMGETVPHGRTNLVFKTNDVVLMFIVNLKSKNHWSNFNENNPKSKEKILEEIIKIRDDRENW